MPESFTQGAAARPAPGPEADLLRRRSTRSRSSASPGRRSASCFPHIGGVADEICIIRSMTTEQINHDPAHMFMNTGSTDRRAARAWARGSLYGLGSEAEDLPGFVVLTSRRAAAARTSRSPRGSGRRLSAEPFQGVQLQLARATRSSTSTTRRASRREQQGDVVDAINALNQLRSTRRRRPGDRHAHRPVRDGVPDAGQRARADGLQRRSRSSVLELYGASPATARSPPTACSPAAWPSAACASSSSTTATGTITAASRTASPCKAEEVDRADGRADHRPEAARHARRHARRLGRRVRPHADVPGGRRPRPPHQGDLVRGSPAAASGRASAYGATDELGYAAVENAVSVHDLHATMLHLLGIDHKRLTVKFQGLRRPADRRDRRRRQGHPRLRNEKRPAPVREQAQSRQA